MRTPAWLRLTCIQAPGDGKRWLFRRPVLVLAALLLGAGELAAQLIPPPPVITQHPQSQTVVAGNSVTFTVVVSSTTAVSYQWRKDGGDIPGATGSSYTIPSVQPPDAGNYTVFVRNAGGSALSDPATLTVWVRPFILDHPQSQTVLAGSTVTFYVAAGGNPPPGYQWRFLGHDIVGANGPMLTLPNVQPAQAGLYSVLVQNAAGAVLSAEAALMVNVQAVFNNDEPLFLPPEGPAAPYPSTLFVSNLPGPVTEVTVELNGLTHNFPDDLDILLVGPAGQSVMLMSDAGDGNAVSDLVVGFDDDAQAPLPDEGRITQGFYKPTNYDPNDPFPPPAPATRSESVTVGLGFFAGTDPNGPWRLFVVDDAADNDGGILGGWRLNLTVTLPPSDMFVVALSGTNEVPATTSPALGYGMVTLHPNGAVSYDIGYSGLVGDYRFSHIHGSAPPDSNAPNIFTLNNTPNGPRAGALRGTINNYTAQQLWDLRNGLQYVNVHSAAFPSGEIRGQIIPLAPPVITRQPQSQTVHEGDPVSFSVVASSATPLTYQWLFNGMPLPDGTNDSWTIPAARSTDAGDYEVVVQNAAGAVRSAKATLMVISQPDIEFVDLPLGGEGQRFFNNTGPPQEPRQTPCGAIGFSPRWLGLRPLDDGVVLLDTLGSGIDTILAVYEGTNAAGLLLLDCDDNGGPDGLSSQVRVRLYRDKTYLVEVDGVNGMQGFLQLNWHFGRPPVITMPPPDMTVMAGETAVFRAQAAGVPPPGYQWQFGGKDIPGATSDTLELKNVRPDQAGFYQVVAANLFGATTSAPARLQVQVPLMLSAPEFRNGRFHFQLMGSPGTTFVIEVSSNLFDWVTVFLTNSPDGKAEFEDPQSGLDPQRFYRAQAY